MPERRTAARVRPCETPWRGTAVLRPGLEVELIDLSPAGVLIASASRLKPGSRAELQLLGPARRLVRGWVSRCRITRLEPLRYEGAIVFDERIEWSGGPSAA